MRPRNIQLPPPQSWIEFESLCLALFKAHWDDPESQKNGRSGQPQHGVDIWGSPARTYGEKTFGVQCKGKNANYGAFTTYNEVLEEIAKAEDFRPRLSHWVFATTAPRDGSLQQKGRELSQARKAMGRFTVAIFGWDDLQDLLCDYPTILKEFYPNYADNIPELIEAVRGLASSTTRLNAEWQSITFGSGRDLRAALLGRGLGPADALACPRLTEADQLVTALEQTSTARLVGEPGVGKSVGAYQAAYTMHTKGWRIYKLANPKLDSVPPIAGFQSEPTLLIIDDAHLMPAWVLRGLESQASTSLCILSTLNALDHEGRVGEYVALDGKRAVKTIAAALRSNEKETIRIVQQVDPDIGERMLDEELERRLDHAEETSATPWQFCFVLGGGWRRAGHVADAARAESLDIVLAISAARQIASRDAIASPAEIATYDYQLEDAEVARGAERLAQSRIFLSTNDCRTPHQRFAAVIIRRILEGSNKAARERLGEAFCHIVRDPSLPLIGIRNLLHEIRFGSGNYVWTHLITRDALDTLAERCWQASTADERGYACLLLSEFDGFDKEVVKAAVFGHEDQLAEWISLAEHPSGYGIGYFLNGFNQKYPELAQNILKRVDPKRVAQAASAATATTAYPLAELIKLAGSIEVEGWRERAAQYVDREACLELGRTWPLDHYPNSFANFCLAISWWDRELAIDMAEAFSPKVQELLERNPLRGLRDIDDILMFCLRVYDPFGVYGKPSARQLKIARSYISRLPPERAAWAIGDMRLRQLQEAAYFLICIRRCSRSKYKAIIEALDWKKLSALYDGEWKSPSHEAEVFLGVLFDTKEAKSLVVDFIAEHAQFIVNLPPRWAVINFDVAIRHLDAGGAIRLGRYGHVDWTFGPFVVAMLSERRPDLVPSLLEPCAGTMAKTFSQTHPSWYEESGRFLRVLAQVQPDFLPAVLAQINIEGAREGWTACLKAKAASRETVALLVECALTLDGDVRRLGEKLRAQFPVASRPKVM